MPVMNLDISSLFYQHVRIWDYYLNLNLSDFELNNCRVVSMFF